MLSFMVDFMLRVRVSVVRVSCFIRNVSLKKKMKNRSSFCFIFTITGLISLGGSASLVLVSTAATYLYCNIYYIYLNNTQIKDIKLSDIITIEFLNKYLNLFSLPNELTIDNFSRIFKFSERNINGYKLFLPIRPILPKRTKITIKYSPVFKMV